MPTHREFLYIRAPEGLPDAGCFRLVEAPIPQPGPGQVLVQTHYLSIDPYMRRQMGASTAVRSSGAKRHAPSSSEVSSPPNVCLASGLFLYRSIQR